MEHRGHGDEQRHDNTRAPDVDGTSHGDACAPSTNGLATGLTATAVTAETAELAPPEEPVQPRPAAPLKELELRRILGTWWPLAASWALMGLEMPLVSAFLARSPDPNIHLAAYGGIVFPLSLLIEAPIIMLLAASTALSKDWASYRKLWRFMMTAGSGLTVLHVLVSFTPLYYVIVRGVIGVPEEIVEPGRWGLMIMTPWTWSIAYRRFQQGVLIRFGHSRAVGMGTLIRLSSNLVVLVVGTFATDLPGIVVGASGIATGVIAEAIFAGLWVRPVLRRRLRPAPPVDEPLTLHGFLRFYVPLAMTSAIGLLWLPMNSVALSRMPLALESLAVWPVLSGVIFVMRSLGIAFNEVVVALIDEPLSVKSLRRFTVGLSLTNMTVLFLIAATPISDFYFVRISSLSPVLVVLAASAIWVAIPQPALAVWQSWFQGVIVHGRKTRGIPEAIAIAMATAACILVAGILHGRITGLYVAITASVTGQAAQLVWLRHRSRSAMREVEMRDAGAGVPAPAEPRAGRRELQP